MMSAGSTYSWSHPLLSESGCPEPKFLRMGEDHHKVSTCLKTARMIRAWYSTYLRFLPVT